MNSLDPAQLRAAAGTFRAALLACDAEHLSPLCVGCGQPKPMICGRYSHFCSGCWSQFPREMRAGLSASAQTAAGAGEWMEYFAVALDGLATAPEEDGSDND